MLYFHNFNIAFNIHSSAEHLLKTCLWSPLLFLRQLYYFKSGSYQCWFDHYMRRDTVIRVGVLIRTGPGTDKLYSSIEFHDWRTSRVPNIILIAYRVQYSTPRTSTQISWVLFSNIFVSYCLPVVIYRLKLYMAVQIKKI